MVRSYLPIRCGIWLRLIANCGDLKSKEDGKNNDLRVLRLEVGCDVAGGKHDIVVVLMYMIHDEN